VKFFLPEDIKTSYQKKWKIRTIDDFLWKLQSADSIERSLMIDFKMCCLYAVLDLPGSAEIYLELSGKFY